MAGQWLHRQASAQERAARIDTRHAHSARIYDFWLGGKDNFAADREAAQEAVAASPEIAADAVANRAFLGRAVRYLAAECGIRQFLDIGTGLPAAVNTHQAAQAVAPAARVVYVDNDPIVLTHARAQLLSGPGGHCDHVDADLREPAAISQAAARTLDLGQPVAVMLLLVLHLIPDAEEPHGIVAALLEAVPPGSYLVVSHPASDIRPAEVAELTRRLNQRMAGATCTVRDRAGISRFFAGLDLVEPGVVQPSQWHPEPGVAGPAEVALWCGVAQKP